MGGSLVLHNLHQTHLAATPHLPAIQVKANMLGIYSFMTKPLAYAHAHYMAAPLPLL